MGEFKAVFSWIGTLLARSAGAGWKCGRPQPRTSVQASV